MISHFSSLIASTRIDFSLLNRTFYAVKMVFFYFLCFFKLLLLLLLYCADTSLVCATYVLLLSVFSFFSSDFNFLTFLVL
jgi:hypothetical protein